MCLGPLQVPGAVGLQGSPPSGHAPGSAAPAPFDAALPDRGACSGGAEPLHDRFEHCGSPGSLTTYSVGGGDSTELIREAASTSSLCSAPPGPEAGAGNAPSARLDPPRRSGVSPISRNPAYPRAHSPPLRTHSPGRSSSPPTCLSLTTAPHPRSSRSSRCSSCEASPRRLRRSEPLTFSTRSSTVCDAPMRCPEGKG